MTDDPGVAELAGRIETAGAVGASGHRSFLEHRRRNRTTTVVRSVCRCGRFSSDWVLSPEIAVQAGLDHTRLARTEPDDR